MARPETPVPGNCYFSVGFYDNDLVLPMIDTLVYVGQSDHDSEHGRMWLFKQPDASPNSEQDGTADDAPALIAFSDKQLHEIVAFSGLIQRIREVAADHPLQPIPNLAADPATAEDFDTLEPEIAKFLNSREYVSLTITIRFTDDGLSLGRRDEAYDIDFFAHPRQDPDEDSRILSFFASVGVQPLVDYFCDRGRTRVLQFPIPSDQDVIVRPCRRVLTEVYSMRRGDGLDYHFLRKSDVGS
jgi:hypothetical protein